MTFTLFGAIRRFSGLNCLKPIQERVSVDIEYILSWCNQPKTIISVMIQAYTLGGTSTQEPLLAPREPLFWLSYSSKDLNTRNSLKT